MSGIIATQYSHFHIEMPAPKAVASHGRSIRDLVKKWESDPQRAGALSVARKSLSNALQGGDRFAMSQLRLQKGLSQSKLGELMGVAQPYVARIERGEDIKISTIEKLAKALGINELEVFSAALATHKSRGTVE